MFKGIIEYYRNKKRRYLADRRAAAREVKAATPQDWEDAEAWAEELERLEREGPGGSVRRGGSGTPDA